MDCKNEPKSVIKYTNEDGTQTFGEGDAVICFTEKGRYTGIIVAFSDYKESEDADPECSVYLDTSKSNMSRSCEIIKITDITYMCRIPGNDLLAYPKTNEVLDREMFINMIEGLGHSKEEAEIMYEGIKELIALYNIPLSSTLASIIKEINIEENRQDELIEISYKFISAMAQVFQTVTGVLEKHAEELELLNQKRRNSDA